MMDKAPITEQEGLSEVSSGLPLAQSCAIRSRTSVYPSDTAYTPLTDADSQWRSLWALQVICHTETWLGRCSGTNAHVTFRTMQMAFTGHTCASRQHIREQVLDVCDVY